MVANLAILYGFDKTAIIALLSPAITALAGRQLASSLLKIIPGLGSLINSGVAAILTESLGGQVHRYLKKAAMNRHQGVELERFKFDWSLFSNMMITRKDKR